MPRIQSLEQVNEVNADLLQVMTADMKFSAIDEALDFHGGSISEIAQTVGSIMRNGASDSSRLQAARLASELRGVAKGKDSSNTINFIISDTNGVQLNNIFNPSR